MAAPTLNTYLQETQRLLRDQRQQMENPSDLIAYINEGRREVALRTMCLRALTPISGACDTVDVTAAGTGYTAPVVTISDPDFPSGQGTYPLGSQATADATVVSGSIASVNITYGGSGYFQPTVTIADPTGTGFEGTVNAAGVHQTDEGREVYNFADVDLSMYPGFGAIYMVKSVSIIYANYRYSLPVYSFSTYQSSIRQYPFQYQYVPTIGAQFGQGTAGSFYLYPLPSTAYQLEWDSFCLPSDLVTNLSVEALPQPWTQAVKYWAAYNAYLELQNPNQARLMMDLFEKQLNVYSTAARPGRASNPYGRWIALLTAGLSAAMMLGAC